eukprot:scaffold5163_cov249-Chaetoceros_neogracile.AAC.1
MLPNISYLRTLLHEIGSSQEDATILYEDNQGALLMANTQKPTKRTRHMDIKVFALQDWVKRDLLNLQRINTRDNYSDAMTKSLGRTLFYCHMNFIMGRIVPAYAYKPLDLTFRRFYDINRTPVFTYNSSHHSRRTHDRFEITCTEKDVRGLNFGMR